MTSGNSQTNRSPPTTATPATRAWPASPTGSSATTGRSIGAVRTRSSDPRSRLRRSRGYAPDSVALPYPTLGRSWRSAPSSRARSPSSVVATPSFRRTLAISTPRRRMARFAQTSSSISRCSRSSLIVIAHDLHPEYLSTKWAQEQDAELIGIQHHHAHAAALLGRTRRNRAGARAGLRWDRLRHRRHALGWRAAALRLSQFERLAHLDPVPLPGGAAAIREPWRVAAVVPRARWPAGDVGAVAVRAREPESERSAVVGHGPTVRRGGGATRSARDGDLRRPGGDRTRAAGRRHRRRRL